MYYAFNIKVAGLARRRKFPLFISQDGTPVHEATQQQAQSYEEVRSYSGWQAVQRTCCCCTLCPACPSHNLCTPLDIHW